MGKIKTEEKDRLIDLIGESCQNFAIDDKELTQTDLVEHKIDTGTEKPVKQKMRIVPYAYRKNVGEMIQDPQAWYCAQIAIAIRFANSNSSQKRQITAFLRRLSRIERNNKER